MPIRFQIFEGKLVDIIKEVIRGTDLVVEGGSGTNIWPIIEFRRLGYKGPYVRMDLIELDDSLEESDSYRTKSGEMIDDFWSYRGNCFRIEHMQPILSKFNPRNPLFLSYSALANALFDRSRLTPYERKPEEDRISIPISVELLNSLYCRQLHISPVGFVTIASLEYIRRHRDKISRAPDVEPYEGLVIFSRDGSLLNLGNFKTFIEESTKAGWQFYLPTNDEDVLYMTKT